MNRTESSLAAFRRVDLVSPIISSHPDVVFARPPFPSPALSPAHALLSPFSSLSFCLVLSSSPAPRHTGSFSITLDAQYRCPQLWCAGSDDPMLSSIWVI